MESFENTPNKLASVRVRPFLGIMTKYRIKRASYNGSIEASQASDVGSIPIARSRNLVDSVALTLLRLENGASWPEFWTQVGPKKVAVPFDRTFPPMSA